LTSATEFRIKLKKILFVMCAFWPGAALLGQEVRTEVESPRVHFLESGTGTPVAVFESGVGEDVSL